MHTFEYICIYLWPFSWLYKDITLTWFGFFLRLKFKLLWRIADNAKLYIWKKKHFKLRMWYSIKSAIKYSLHSLTLWNVHFLCMCVFVGICMCINSTKRICASTIAMMFFSEWTSAVGVVEVTYKNMTVYFYGNCYDKTSLPFLWLHPLMQQGK